MIAGPRLRIPAWAATVFLLALAARLAFLFLVDQPLLFTHQYTYFANALRIAQHPRPLAFILQSDSWRTWEGQWLIAPLYYVFAGGVLRLSGGHPLPLQLLQCIFDSVVAVGAAALGRRVAGPRGHWAGVVYALHWPAIELPTWTLTENAHTLLFLGGIWTLADATESTRRLVAGGVLLGLSALARSVSSAFIGLVALTRVAGDGLRRGGRPAALILAGGAAMIVPWIVRNAALGQPPTIETAVYENIWTANTFGDKQRMERENQAIYSQTTPEAARAIALDFALKAIRKHPGLFVVKTWDNFWHFLRPDWLDGLLRVERPADPPQWAAGFVSEDVVLLVTLPLFAVFLLAGRPSPARTLILLWTAYYLFMVIVVFHNELRYRSALVPFAFAGAAGGLAVLADPDARRGTLARIALAVGLALSIATVRPYAFAAWRALAAARAASPAAEAVARGDVAEAQSITETASALDPRSSRPWRSLGHQLIVAGRPVEAVEAFRRAVRSGKPDTTVATLVLPRLLAEAGRPEESALALREADLLSWNTDPWLALETAWRELPPPKTDTIVVGRGDYGAVRGFLHPRGGDPRLTRRFLAWNQYDAPGQPQPPPGPHRWSRHRAWLRLIPTQPAEAYVVTLTMGSPFPSPVSAPDVTLRAGDGEPARFTLSAELRPYSFRAASRPREPIVVRLDAPTWNLPGEPAEQGVRVDTMTVAPTE